ncbi:MAG: HindVP family restriction endonuclease [Bacteroidota bacterium]
MTKSIQPSLFGINHSNRDFSIKDSWSKNNFNSSFPASLIAYMDSKNIPCVYLKLNEKGEVVKDYISAKELYHLNPLDDNLYYSFESAYTPYQPLSIGTPPRVDLMLMNNLDSQVLAGYEVKLTTLPDESSFKLAEDKWGCELVIRMPSIHFLACSLAAIYKGEHEKMRKYFGKNGFGNIGSYTEAAQVNPRLGDIWERMNLLIKDNIPAQKPAIIQPVWKTMGKTSVLADNCLDVFVWSDLAFTQLFMSEARSVPNDLTIAVNRPTRALIQLFFMLNEVSVKGTFYPHEIFQKLTYTMKNDKAFSVPGRKTNPFMRSEELLKPRITKDEIKNIILGGGHLLLSPERRFDAALVSSPNLFV